MRISCADRFTRGQCVVLADPRTPVVVEILGVEEQDEGLGATVAFKVAENWRENPRDGATLCGSIPVYPTSCPDEQRMCASDIDELGEGRVLVIPDRCTKTCPDGTTEILEDGELCAHFWNPKDDDGRPKPGYVFMSDGKPQVVCCTDSCHGDCPDGKAPEIPHMLGFCDCETPGAVAGVGGVCGLWYWNGSAFTQLPLPEDESGNLSLIHI